MITSGLRLRAANVIMRLVQPGAHRGHDHARTPAARGGMGLPRRRAAGMEGFPAARGGMGAAFRRRGAGWGGFPTGMAAIASQAVICSAWVPEHLAKGGRHATAYPLDALAEAPGRCRRRSLRRGADPG